MYRPNFVLLVITTAMKTITPEIHTGKGIPNSHPVPRCAKFSPRPVIGNPFVHNIVKPLAIVSIASVATNGGTLNFVIVQPLNQPSNEPTSNPATVAPSMVKPIYKLDEGISIPFFNRPAVIAPHNASTDPTERSMPAVSTTSVIPTEMQMFTDICRITFHAFVAVKNLSDSKLMTRHSMIKSIKD